MPFPNRDRACGGDCTREPQGRQGRPRRAAAALVGFALHALADPEKPKVPEAPVRIEVRARPIAAFEPRDPSRQRFGQLEFRGGLDAPLPYKEFGGISAIRVARTGPIPLRHRSGPLAEGTHRL